ncbi:MAG: tRNA uridine(34) 5-carboxymethylaminomethyl modification radical SAM/GNAT enzyme Elp3 [Candidatus Bathyarchaeia archaeon]
MARAIVCRLLSIPKPSREDVERIKLEVSRLHGAAVPGNYEIIGCMTPEERVKLLPVLRRKSVRTISGVAVVSVMADPHPCPHGRCAYCPSEPGVPVSYTGHEPAAMRAIQNEFDPLRQVSNRIAQLGGIGHDVGKVELIIQGGTFPATALDYQEGFVRRCLDAITGRGSSSIGEAKSNAEAGRIRNVGITVETRPDWAKEKDVDNMLSLGVTRVELGVQNIYDDIYTLVGRGHRVEDVVGATKILKDAGLKVCYHMMPGLPGSSFERDIEAFHTIFEDPRFKPDMLKIYPCLVLRGTEVYEWWLRGEYQPYTTDEASDLILEIKKFIPPWVRIMRVQRDIPAQLIMAGVNKSNLRQLVLRRLKEQGLACRCIRCREVGHRALKDGVKPDPRNICIVRTTYEASDGAEVFLSVEDLVSDVLIGYLRLRIPSGEAQRPEIGPSNTSIVREVRVCGPSLTVGRRSDEAWQHRGYGKLLLSEAERISSEDFDRSKIVVMSALGTKRYFMRFGYKHDGPYMAKVL